MNKGPDSARIATEKGVARVIPDVTLTQVDSDCTVLPACATPNDPLFDRQWYLENNSSTIEPGDGGTLGVDIDIARGWAQTGMLSPVKIAIIDSGIDPNQPDLASRISADWAIPEDDGNTTDVSGHGTAVAGIAAATSNNEVGIAGIAPNASILNIKVSTPKSPERESCSALSEGISTAVSEGAKVINISAGSFTPCVLEQEAITYAWNHGALIVAAAGNYGSSEPFYPAAYNYVISVAATDAEDRPGSFADGGATDRSADWIDLAAPGVDILTTLPTYANAMGAENYGFVDGTSFSAPMVAGAAALLFGEGLTNREVRERLLNRADPITGTGTDWKYGLLDICAAIAIDQSSCPQSVSVPAAPVVNSSTVTVNINTPKAIAPSVSEPAPTASDTAAPGTPRRPPSGVYRGLTSEQTPLTARLTANGSLSLTFTYRSGCEKKRPRSILGASDPKHPVSLTLHHDLWAFRLIAYGPKHEPFKVRGRFSGTTISGSLKALAGVYGSACTREQSVGWTATS